MRTFKYTYLDAKGNQKESTVEADDKDDAYIILKTMRINPVTITQTEAEDIVLEVIGADEEKKKKESRPPINYGRPRAAGAKSSGGKSTDEIEIGDVVAIDDLKRVVEPKARKKAYRPPYEIFALFCVGVALLGWAAWAAARDSAHLDWPTANGYVKYCDMLVSGIFDKVYKPDIRCLYSVSGVPYQSTNTFFEETETSRGEVTVLMKRYPLNRKVYVHYNPDDPQDSYLESQVVETPHTFSAALGLLCLAAAAGMFVVAKLNEPAKPKAKPKPKPGPAPKGEDIEITTWSAHVK